MLLSPLCVSPFGIASGSTVFTINNSFLLDGVNESFSVTPFASMDSQTNGSISVVFKSADFSSAASRCVFSYNDGTNYVAIRFYSNTFSIFVRTGGANQWVLVGTGTPIANNTWYHLVIVQNGTNPVVYLNGATITQSFTLSTNKTKWFNDITGTEMNIGKNLATGSTWEFEGYIQQVAYISQVLTLSDCANLYNGGKPKSPQTLFGANCKFFFNADKSGDVAQFTVFDSVNSINATSVNMEDSDKTSVTPY